MSLSKKKFALLSLSFVLSLGVATSSSKAKHSSDTQLAARSEQNAAQINSVKANGTQLKYWIELDREGKKHHVTNQETFHTGDKIKFHLQSTADGFLYIVLRSGSRGEQEILFPHPKLKDDNHIVKNTDYVLPADDYLLFDEFPGTEKLVLMFSNKPIELKQALAVKKHVVMRGGAGSKDLVPAGESVSYTSNDTTPPGPAAAATASTESNSGTTTTTAKATATTNGPAVTAKTDAVKASTSTTATASASSTTGPGGTGSHGDVVVQHDDPNEVLAVDIDLVHSK